MCSRKASVGLLFVFHTLKPMLHLPTQPALAGPKPKAKAKSLKERTLAWKKLKLEDEDEGGAEEGEEEEVLEEDPEVDTKEKRNYGKARKFARAPQAGEIPDDIKEMYNNASKYSNHPRLFRTELVNRLFKKTSKGEFVLCHGEPTFASWKRNQDIKFTAAESVGVPYMVILWQTFHGQEHALQEALKTGDVYESHGLYHHRRMTAGRSKTSTESMQLDGGKVAIDTDQFAGMSSFLGGKKWSQYGQQAMQDSPPQPRVKRSQQLTLEDVQPTHPRRTSSQLALPGPATTNKVVKVDWVTFQQIVSEAKAANERLQRDCSRLVMKVRGGDQKLTDDMKAVVNLLTENLQSLQECQMWEEVPGSDGNEKNKVEAYFKQIAEKTEKANESMEQVKAVCKARGL